ncbi:hypothetical protein Cgig2_009873 [Carnegiea gigantea]|uniref:Thioredoxin domain-containing protein n=1 Tax=Carnegiea gigantea TaxID=171969 RepID=A0A9Q1K8C8_9CARY|nr:hypothetical protein Cgig2_009873 [Carnegiea gigantea]
MEGGINQDQNQPTKLDHPSQKPPFGGSSGGDRLKRDEWSEGAVSSLLEAYEAKWILRNRAKLKGQDWEDVARHVSSRANNTKSPKTQTQCKNKIESMKKRYRSESATSDTSSWPLFSRLDHLLRGTGGSGGPPPPQPPIMVVQPPPALKATHMVGNTGLVLLESSGTAPPLPPPAAQPPPPPPPPPPRPRPPPSPQPSIEIAQNSQESNGLDPMAKDQNGEGTGKSSDQVSEKNQNHQDHNPETDSSTPALYSDRRDKGQKLSKLMKRKRMRRRTREDGSWDDIAESIRWLAESVVRSEQARMDTMREVERMRVEAEAKRGEMDLKRTEIIANTQLEIARLFASAVAAKEVQELVKGEREVPIIIDFYATWCGPCILMAQELEMLAVEYENNALIVKVDTDDEYEFARDMQVRGLPTMYFISPNQRKNAIRTEGLIPIQMMRDILDNEM